MAPVLSWVWRRRKWAAIVTVSLVLLGTVGAVTSSLAGRRPIWRELVTCRYAGRSAWVRARARHPAWSTARLYAATHRCVHSGRGYRG